MTGTFILEFACLDVTWNGVKQRGLVIAQAEIPGTKNMVLVGVALEREPGKIVQMVIPKIDLLVAQRNGVTLVEKKDEKGPSVGEKLILTGV